MTDEGKLFDVLPLYAVNRDSRKRTKVNQGGTSSGKTYSIMQVLFVKAMERYGLVITVAGQDVPNLKKGAFRDAKKIRNDSQILQVWFPKVNEGERVFQCINGSIIEFSSFKDAQDAKSGKRNILFVNEANGIPFDIFWQLYIRTSDEVFIDYNPSARFWVHEKMLNRNDVQLIISDHRQNRFLTQEQHDMIEGIEDEELWKVYARGATGAITGLVFPRFNVVDALPPREEWKMHVYCLDFGFTNDPTALIHLILAHGELWMDELLYNTGMTNPMIAERAKAQGLSRADVIIADSAEPKSIRELNNLGLYVEACVKGADSIKNGIDILQRYTLNVTRRSTGLRKEFLNYKWKVTKDGITTNEPVDCFNHAIDAVRYGALARLKIATKPRGITVRQ
jgi:phage terminase large subunit